MELDRNQPSVGGLRETLAPWYDHAAAWVVLLCVVLTVIFSDLCLCRGRILRAARLAPHPHRCNRCRNVRCLACLEPA